MFFHQLILQPPASQEHWLAISKQFEFQWNLPHVIGALDGKHIRIQCRPGTETLFHNYKGFVSMVLLALCDANYCFTLIDIDQYGSNNYSVVLAQSFFDRFPGGFFPIPLFITWVALVILATFIYAVGTGENRDVGKKIHNG